jgi:Replication-relaxation
MPRQSFSKFKRATEPVGLPVITDRDLDLLAAILRYRFSPASELVRLVGGNERVTLRRLTNLWKAHLVNRFAFPGIPPSEFHYYLDNRAALDLLAERRNLRVLEPMLAELKNNRDKDYASAAVRGQHMQLGFLKHALMISRFHFMLEQACRASSGQVQLEGWRQGGELAGQKVELPRVTAVRQEGSNEYVWQRYEDTVLVPVEPDALFTLRLPVRQAGFPPLPFGPAASRLVHFCYEADRGTMVATDMLKKMRGYYHFIKRQQLHRQAWDVHPIRAVLIETTDEDRGNKLMELVNHPLVAGPNRRAGLFWFTISPLFTGEDADQEQPVIAPYLLKPEIVLKNIWALPDRTLHALGDEENSGK